MNLNLNNQSAKLSPMPDIDIEKKKEEQQKRNEWLKEKMELRHKQQIQFIMTQTNYDENEATQKLQACNYDAMKVVSEYLGIAPKKDEYAKKTKNQKVFSVIRDIMDSGSRNFMMQQDRAKKLEEIKKTMEMKKQNEQIEQTESQRDKNNIRIMKEKID